MKKTFLLTGATGFVGSYLLKTLLEHGHVVYVLARANRFKDAKTRVQEVLVFWSVEAFISNVIIVEGNIENENFGFDAKTMATLGQNIDEIFHSAAITDLNLPKDQISKVNIDGTRQTLELARQLTEAGRFKKTNHISTAYIYGDFHGVFTEENLNVGQKFSNTYEESKFQAELLIGDYRKQGLWIDVYRAPIVIGHSKTGKTFQFKHIYQFINLCKLELFDTLPVLGMHASVACIDLLCNAIYVISQNMQEKNKNYHPFPNTPISIEQVVEYGATLIGFRRPKFTALKDFRVEDFTPVQNILLRNSILSVDFDVTLDSSSTNRLLNRFNCVLPRIDENVLVSSLSYFVNKAGFIKV